jgi:ABC-type thiamine transport system ATPase subunit
MLRHLTAFIMFLLLRMSSLARRIRRNLAKSEGDDSYQTPRRPHSRPLSQTFRDKSCDWFVHLHVSKNTSLNQTRRKASSCRVDAANSEDVHPAQAPT